MTYERTLHGLKYERVDVAPFRMLRIQGNIDTESFHDFEDVLEGTLEPPGVRGLILDLERAPLVNSMGIGTIVRAYRQLQDRQGALVLLNPSPGIRQVLHTLGLEKRLPIRAMLEDAREFLESITGGAPPAS